VLEIEFDIARHLLGMLDCEPNPSAVAEAGLEDQAVAEFLSKDMRDGNAETNVFLLLVDLVNAENGEEVGLLVLLNADS